MKKPRARPKGKEKCQLASSDIGWMFGIPVRNSRSDCEGKMIIMFGIFNLCSKQTQDGITPLKERMAYTKAIELLALECLHMLGKIW